MLESQLSDRVYQYDIRWHLSYHETNCSSTSLSAMSLISGQKLRTLLYQTMLGSSQRQLRGKTVERKWLGDLKLWRLFWLFRRTDRIYCNGGIYRGSSQPLNNDRIGARRTPPDRLGYGRLAVWPGTRPSG